VIATEFDERVAVIKGSIRAALANTAERQRIRWSNHTKFSFLSFVASRLTEDLEWP
jgi:hypothetical protein